MRIAYFVHELQDPAVLKRVRMLEAGGGECILLGFQRKRFASKSESENAGAFVLGQTHSGRFAARALSVLLAIPRAWSIRSAWAKADVILARNLEMLFLACALAWLMRLRTRIVYECLDIHRLMLGAGPVNKLLRRLERACLDRAALLLTSSPAFVSAYFAPKQNYQGAVLISENKILPQGRLDAPANDVGAPKVHSPGPPWVIAWCGVLRCQRSLEILAEATRRLGGEVRVELWGVPAREQMPNFDAIIAAAPQLRFNGRYAPENLAQIYRDAHFVWAVDYYEAGGNSDWLLPNRLYEGLAYGAVPIAVEGVETARWLAGRQVGVVLADDPLTSFVAFFNTLTRDHYSALARAAAALDPSATRFNANDCRALVSAICGAELARAA